MRIDAGHQQQIEAQAQVGEGQVAHQKSRNRRRFRPGKVRDYRHFNKLVLTIEEPKKHSS